MTLSNLSGFETNLLAPKVQMPETFHMTLEVEDQGKPSLRAYRRPVTVTITIIQP